MLGGRSRWLLLAAPAAALLMGADTPPSSSLNAAQCAALKTIAVGNAPVTGLTILSADWRDAGLTVDTRAGKSGPLPGHCEVTGHYGERPGLIGGPYRTQFHMRLPAAWNGRYFFQGGGGSNGVIGDALGQNGPGNPSAIERGYAVISQDSGHDNATNTLASRGGDLVFGHDPQARADYGHTSLKPSYDLGLYLLRSAYGRDPQTKIFWGCSKGGQEGMAFAQRYPEAFDGIVAAAPGFALPRAAIAEAWDVQQFASVLRAEGKPVTLDNLKSAISDDQMKLVTQTVRATCDRDDGLEDGILGAVGKCTSARIIPALRKKICVAGNVGTCLSNPQITALANIMAGPKNKSGKALYANWAWDSGMAEPGWRVWKVGLENGPPALNVMLGGGSLAAVFSTPSVSLSPDPAKLLAWQLAFDFDRDAPRIYATGGGFHTSAWTDVGMRSTDLSAFRAHGGKLIVPHGVSDPVFSVLDTINWWEEVDRRNKGRAADFARIFPVPGMNHCMGGPATDRFDSLTALENWVLTSRAPNSIQAVAGAQTPWPGRSRPLCPYPKVARYSGKGDINRAESFSCKL
jgi:Tannase and feruloyl esterase